MKVFILGIFAILMLSVDIGACGNGSGRIGLFGRQGGILSRIRERRANRVAQASRSGYEAVSYSSYYTQSPVITTVPVTTTVPVSTTFVRRAPIITQPIQVAPTKIKIETVVPMTPEENVSLSPSIDSLVSAIINQSDSDIIVNPTSLLVASILDDNNIVTPSTANLVAAMSIDNATIQLAQALTGAR